MLLYYPPETHHLLMQRTGSLHVAMIVELDGLGDGLCIDVRSRTDAPGSTKIERIKERHFRTRIDHKTLNVEQLARVLEVARTVLDPDEVLGMCLMKTRRQRRRNTDYGDRWYVVQVDARIVADRCKQLLEVALQRILGDGLEIERREGS